MEPEASVIVPVHNEAGIIRVNTERLREYLCERLPSHEIVFCENGSTDGTVEIVRGLAEEFDDVEFLVLPEPNLAEALKSGFKAARGEKVIYFPIDLSVNLSFIPESVRLLDMFDAVIGSKRLASELDRRPFVRRVASKGYHGMVRRFFGVGVTDTTCVKAFRRSKILALMERVPTSSRVFETELLVESGKEGFDIVEVPVCVEEHRQSREVLGRKIQRKLEDLLSARLDRIFLFVGVPMFLVGLSAILALTIWKLMSVTASGFVNPYSFLLSMLLIISGFQFITFGLLTNLIMQIRRQVAQAIRDRD